MDPSPKVKEIKAKINKWASQVALLVKNLLAKAEDIRDEGSIPELGSYPGEGKGYALQYSDLENSMDHIIHGVARSWTQLSDFLLLFFFNCDGGFI